MPSRLRMSGEISDWLTEISSDLPAVAAEIGAALVALLDGSPGPALVGASGTGSAPLDAGDVRQAVRLAADLVHEAAQTVRGDLAAAERDVRHWQEALTEARRAGRPADVLAKLEFQLGRARGRQSELAARAERADTAAAALRRRAEAIAARHTAAAAALHIAARPAGSAPEQGPPAEVAAAERAVRVLTAEAGRLVAEAAVLRLDLAGPDVGGTHPGQQDTSSAGKTTADARATPGPGSGAGGPLLELHADPLGTGVLILFVEEPAGTITLLAVLDSAAAVAAHRAEAAEAAGELLAEIRAGEWPPPESHTAADKQVSFPDAATFLDAVFAGEAAAIRHRAAALTAMPTLAGLRQARGVSLATLAAQTGISVPRLALLEQDSWRAAQLHEVVACLRALRGTLELPATVPGPAAPARGL